MHTIARTCTCTCTRFSHFSTCNTEKLRGKAYDVMHIILYFYHHVPATYSSSSSSSSGGGGGGCGREEMKFMFLNGIEIEVLLQYM